MNQQDLVWVKLPFSNLRQSKVRPALVVSNNSYNNSNPDIVVCAVTSKLKESEYSVQIGNKDLTSGNLPIKSRVRADKILQIEKELVIRPFAKIENKVFDKVVDKVGDLIKRR
ncbi:type II toxin-antitoxin system PemK/MazF family toxin [Candidatus Woesearchaeota archaeon]|nr:type II toxin-antitoxin system PemK/MazF family toxin [Candidatus Woesearchaeota archaeon]